MASTNDPNVTMVISPYRMGVLGTVTSWGPHKMPSLGSNGYPNVAVPVSPLGIGLPALHLHFGVPPPPRCSYLRSDGAPPRVPPIGAVAVAEFIAESPRLLRLDLRENEIKTGGLMALALALKVNQSLLRLDLDRDPKKEAVRWGGGSVMGGGAVTPKRRR